MALEKCGIMPLMRMKLTCVQNYCHVVLRTGYPLGWLCDLICLSVIFFVVGCSGDRSPAITTTMPTPAVVAAPTEIPITTAEAEVVLPAQRRLVVWVPEFFDASLEREAVCCKLSTSALNRSMLVCISMYR